MLAYSCCFYIFVFVNDWIHEIRRGLGLQLLPCIERGLQKVSLLRQGVLGRPLWSQITSTCWWGIHDSIRSGKPSEWCSLCIICLCDQEKNPRPGSMKVQHSFWQSGCSTPKMESMDHTPHVPHCNQQTSNTRCQKRCSLDVFLYEFIIWSSSACIYVQFESTICELTVNGFFLFTARMAWTDNPSAGKAKFSRVRGTNQCIWIFVWLDSSPL